MPDIDAVITGALIFSAVMGTIIYIGRNPKPPKKKGFVMPKIGKGKK